MNQFLHHLLAARPSKSGGERAAGQTLRAVPCCAANAERLDCGGFSTAFERGWRLYLPTNFRRVLSAGTFIAIFLGFLFHAPAADKYLGHCDVGFEADSTLHAFTGDITNIAVLVLCDTNASGETILNTRIEIGPKQLTTHHEKRDANMYKMFQPDRFPKLIVVVTNAPLAAARLAPTNAPGAAGVLPIQLTFCGITKAATATTSNPKPSVNGWEFDLTTEVSLKAFKLEPSSALFGMISVDDKVVIKAHVKVQKEISK
jgi:hypothetical protein